MAQKKLFLLDAMALIYRAYFAFSKSPRINSKGMNTSAVLGFTNTLLEILNNEKPDYIGVAFDSHAPTFRHNEFPEYKATRDSMPEDLALSIPWIKDLIKAFRIPIIELEGYEADDIIGTLATIGEKEGLNVFMMTPDKDFGQLVTDRTKIYKPARMGSGAEILGVNEVCKKYGISYPAQLIDILALWGDASDNIPGIPGIGEVTASKLIGIYGSIENLFQNTSQLKGKQKENIEKYQEQALLSKKLATIVTDAPIPFDQSELLLKDPDREALLAIFNELEFKTLAARYFKEEVSTFAESKPAIGGGIQTSLFDQPEIEFEYSSNFKTINDVTHNYKWLEGEADALELKNLLLASKSFCFDTETTSLDIKAVELVGISFSLKQGEAMFLHVPPEKEEALKVIEIIKPAFEQKGITKIAQNLKYDIQVLKNYGITVQGPFFDTMIAHYLLNPESRHNMDFLAETYLQYATISYDVLVSGGGKTKLNIRAVDKNKLKDYACEDADITLQLSQIFEVKLKEEGFSELFTKVEIPLVPVLADMEYTGVHIDTKALKEFSVQLGIEIEEVANRIYRYAGFQFNIASPKQLGEVLFDRLKIVASPKRTRTKQYSTSEDVLSKLVNHHPIVSDILEYRSLSKLKSTYVDAFPELINPLSDRIHTSYNQAVTATGRLSSNNPNLQNIPIRTDRGREIRKAFTPLGSDYVLISADYSQIELRIIAHLSGDEAMLQAFRSGADIHTATAAGIYGAAVEEVDSQMRRNAKMVNFGIIYGISAFGLAERLNIPRSEAAFIIDEYFRQYPGIKAYMEKSIEVAREKGYVETMLGRRRYLRDINSSNNNIRQFAERNAINAPIQGTSADMIKIAMINIHKELETLNLATKMIMQVHDELIFEAPKNELDIVKPIIVKGMKEAIALDIPVEVELNSGANWLEAH